MTWRKRDVKIIACLYENVREFPTEYHINLNVVSEEYNLILNLL